MDTAYRNGVKQARERGLPGQVAAPVGARCFIQ